MPYYARREIFATVSTNVTSETYNVEGFYQLSVQNIGSASTLTLQVSNDTGRASTVANWSDFTVLAAPGIIEMAMGQLGHRWMRGLRSSNTLQSVLGGWRD